MRQTVGNFLSELMSASGYTQSRTARELGISRQALSYIILGQRAVSLPVSLKIESLFSLPEGTVLQIQNRYDIEQYKLRV